MGALFALTTVSGPVAQFGFMPAPYLRCAVIESPEDNAELLVRSYAKFFLRKIVVRSQASLAACASKRGVVSVLNPCCTPA